MLILCLLLSSLVLLVLFCPRIVGNSFGGGVGLMKEGAVMTKGQEKSKKAYSVKIAIRCDTDILNWARECAEKRGVTVTRVLREMIQNQYQQRRTS